MEPPSKRRKLAHPPRHHHAHAGQHSRDDIDQEALAISQYAATFRTVPQRVEEIHLRIQTQTLPAEDPSRLHRRQGSGSGLLPVSIGLDVGGIASVGVELGGNPATQTRTATHTGAASTGSAVMSTTTQPPSTSRNGTASMSRNQTAHDFHVTQNSSLRPSNGTINAANAVQTSVPSMASLSSPMSSEPDTMTDLASSTFTDMQTQTTFSTVTATPGVGSGSNGGSSNGASNPSNNESSGGSNNGGVSKPGALAGGVVGGAAGLALILLIAMLFIRWSRRKSQNGHQALRSAPGDTNTDESVATSRGPGMAERAGLRPLAAALPVFLRHQSSREQAVPSSERGFTRVSGRKLPSQFSAGMSSSTPPPDMPMPGPERSNSNSSWLNDPFSSDGGSPPGEMTLSPGPQRVPTIHGAGPYHAIDRSVTPGQEYDRSRSVQGFYDRSATASTVDNRASRFTEEV